LRVKKRLLSEEGLGGGGGGFSDDFANGSFEALDRSSRLDVRRDRIPESDSAGKERVKMAVDRGVRDKVVG